MNTEKDIIKHGENRYRLNKITLFIFIFIAFIPWIPAYIKLSHFILILFDYFSKLLCTIIILYIIYKLWIANKLIEEKNIFIEELNIIDESSGLYNLSYFYKQIDKEVERAVRQEYPLFLGILDLNQNKEITKYIGEVVEEHVLENIGKIITDNIRKNVDSVYRYNENIFSIIIPDVNTEQVKMIGERILQKFIIYKNNPKHSDFSMSIGFIQYRSGWEPRTYSQRAYMSMLEAKKTGKDQIMIF